MSGWWLLVSDAAPECVAMFAWSTGLISVVIHVPIMISIAG
jgi:hypothetical protein